MQEGKYLIKNQKGDVVCEFEIGIPHDYDMKISLKKSTKGTQARWDARKEKRALQQSVKNANEMRTSKNRL